MSPARILFLTTYLRDFRFGAIDSSAQRQSIDHFPHHNPTSLFRPNDQPRLWLATSWSPDQGFNQLRDQLAPSSLKLWDFKSEIHNEIHNEIFTEITTEI